MESKEEVKTRIYVGGLGEKVTSDDLGKIFSSLGDVKAVDIVRTKGRSFGYVDFFPSSDKSLSKLFSTYNGCVWKGGRLRLEKAKEHYLARLNREWAEDSQLASIAPTESVDAEKDTVSLEKSKKVLNSANNLHIFFPRLRKVKALPFSGTGKHKYSFQRVEAPPLPGYFCDCEEHSVPSCTATGKQMQNQTAEVEMHGVEAESGGVNEEELKIMNTVMNKLFERENFSKAASHEVDLANVGHNTIKLIEDLQLNENEEDEDNIVINVVSRGNNKTALSQCQEISTTSPRNQKSAFSEKRNSKGRPAQSLPESWKISNKKRKSLVSEESTTEELVSANPGGGMNLQTPLGAEPAGTKSSVKQSTANHSWSQKLSWKALVGDKDGSAFNVSSLLPVVASTKGADSAIESIDVRQFDENETDEDNLIINVVSKKNNKEKLSGNQEQGSKLTVMQDNQKSTSNVSQKSEDRRVQSVTKDQNNRTPLRKKKKTSLNSEESDVNEMVSTIPEGSGTLQTHTNGLSNPSGAQPTEPESSVKQSIPNPLESQKYSFGELVEHKDKDVFTVSNMLRDISTFEQPVSDVPIVPESIDSENKISSYENLEGKLDNEETVEVPDGRPSEINESTSKSDRGSSWFQKSPWTQLVTENNNSFSITLISPSITFRNHELTKSQRVANSVKNTDSMGSNVVKEDKSESSRSGSTTVDCSKEGGNASNLLEKNQQTVVGNNEASATIDEYNNHSVQDQMPKEDVSISETCLFMRSAASLKEWAKAKAALSGSHKRKSNEK